MKWNAAIINQLILPHQSEHMQKFHKRLKRRARLVQCTKSLVFSRATSQNLSRFEVRGESHYWAIQAFQGTTCLKVCVCVHLLLDSGGCIPHWSLLLSPKTHTDGAYVVKKILKCNPKPLQQSCYHGSQKLLCHNNKSLKVEIRMSSMLVCVVVLEAFF